MSFSDFVTYLSDVFLQTYSLKIGEKLQANISLLHFIIQNILYCVVIPILYRKFELFAF